MTAVFHVQGFARAGNVREVHVAQHEARTVIEVAKGVIERATSSEGTELVELRRTWPISGYGQEAAVVQVDAVTKTTLDGGKTWSEMWHWFGTLSSPWPRSGADGAEIASPVARPVPLLDPEHGVWICPDDGSALSLVYARSQPLTFTCENCHRVWDAVPTDPEVRA